eukprot:CAMPEP_0178823008 /NCGR_PEP_ID=MMETSP0746-20121128/4905_1 /TAXON_ID=913974 /ORGANISM="Nitzschia punctata, Strain CCMP561" /LENGTH=75 /DNA_ID=CAMNT_0020484569 /DNA_START=171 /DNA_END=395 /DNA_ORIENTATION=-
MSQQQQDVIIRSLQPEDAPHVAKIWVDGLQQTRDALASRWVVGRLVSYLMDKLEETATSPKGHVGPEGCNLMTFW